MNKEIPRFLKEKNHFLVAGHMNADGDAVASVLAMGSILTQLKKKYRIVMHDNPLKPKFKFLKGFDKIESYKDGIEGERGFESAILLDTANLDRLGDVKNLLPKESKIPILNVDHHVSNTFFGTLNLVDEKASSTCEVIYSILQEIDEIEIDKDLATYIYTGIVYDTGRFAFSNTTINSMRICAEMLNRGADCHEVSKHIYFEKSFESMKILGRALQSMELHFNGKVGLIVLEADVFLNNNNSDLDLDNLVNYASSIEGVEVGILLREEEKGRFRVSLRSKDRVDVNRIAAAFNGGGHSKAAGCYINGNLKETKELLLKELKGAFE